MPLALPPASFAGRYALGQMLLELREHDDALYFRMGGGELRRLAATGPATFATSEAGLSLEFRLDENRSITGVDLLAAGRTLTAERLEPVILTAKDAREYEGRYHSEELNTSYRVIYENGQLVAKHLRGTDIVLTAYGRDRFLESGGGDLNIQFKRSRRGRVTGFEMSVDRARAIAFDRI